MGKKLRQQQIREMLTENPDGMCASEIAARIGIPQSNVHNTVLYMPDVYEDRWDVNEAGTHWIIVFCLWKKPVLQERPAMKPSDYVKQRIAA